MPDKMYLKQLQSLPLEAKIVLTKQRIREWYEYFNGDVYVSFSGGKDSTVLAHIVHEMYPDVKLVYCNTGLEYPEIQAFAKKMGAEFVRPKKTFSEVITEYGYPIISKEVAESIQYARRIINGSEKCGGGGTRPLDRSKANSAETECTETDGSTREKNRPYRRTRRKALTGTLPKIYVGGVQEA